MTALQQSQVGDNIVRVSEKMRNLWDMFGERVAADQILKLNRPDYERKDRYPGYN